MVYVAADGSWADPVARTGMKMTAHWSDPGLEVDWGGMGPSWARFRLPEFHFNTGVKVPVVSATPHEDFTAGELTGDLPVGGFGFGDNPAWCNNGPIKPFLEQLKTIGRK